MASTQDIGNHILKSLPAADLERLRPHLRRVRLTAGQVLYEPGDDVDRVYFPESGLISLLTPLEDGVEVENTSRGRDGGIGYVEACGSEMMVSRAVVQIAGEAWCLPACWYREAYEASGAMRNIIHRRIEILLADARQTSACRAVHPASGRLARTLLEAAEHTGEHRLRLTQSYLAGMIGVGRTTVTSAASRLQELGLIRYTRGSIRISNPEGLRRYACECYDALQDVRRQILERRPHQPRPQA